MTELPAGWSWARFAEVADIASDLVDPGTWPDAPHIAPNHIESGTSRLTGVTTVADDGVTSPKHRFRSGQILYSKIRPYLAKVTIAPYAGLCSADMYPINAHIDERFLLHWMLSDAFTESAAAHQGRSVLPKINQPALKGLTVPVAPIAEQVRIVAAIEEAFSQLDAGEGGLRAARQLLKRTRDAILAAAVNGRLVPQDPADTPAAKLLAELDVEQVESDTSPEIPAGWAAVRVAAIAKVGSGTTPKRDRADYWTAGQVPWVASGAVNAGTIREATEFVTETALRETSLRLWPAGTLLVAMYGEGQTRGRCAELAIEATCNQACAAIALLPELAGYKQTLRLHFDANYAANRRLAAGGVQPNLSGALIKEMVVALPPPEEASRIVAEVERQMSFIEECERSVDAGLEVSAALRRSVLRSAFEGRLVPQDPTDEPASVLLERIRAERAAVPKPKNRRTRATA